MKRGTGTPVSSEAPRLQLSGTFTLTHVFRHILLFHLTQTYTPSLSLSLSCSIPLSLSDFLSCLSATRKCQVTLSEAHFLSSLLPFLPLSLSYFLLVDFQQLLRFSLNRLFYRSARRKSAKKNNFRHSNFNSKND